MSEIEKAKPVITQEPTDYLSRTPLYSAQYNYSKFVRGDNQPENAKNLGYLDAQEMYPDFRPVSFESYIKEVFDGTAGRIYTRSKWLGFAQRR